MFLSHQHDRATDHIAQQNLLDFSRLQCARNQYQRIIAPSHNVDALASQFASYVLDAIAAHAHAGTHAIDALIEELTATLLRWPGSRLMALILITPSAISGISFSNSRWNQLRTRTAQDHFHAIARWLDFEDHRANAITIVISLRPNFVRRAAG